MTNVLNVVKGGSTAPFKFEIFAGPTELTDISNFRSFSTVKIICDLTSATDEIETTATGGYRVTMTTQDGSSLVAYFKIR